MRQELKHASSQVKTRVRGPYVTQACIVCRRRKIKCKGEKPKCDPCLSAGYECGWGEEIAKRPSTRLYVESLKNRIKFLEASLSAVRRQLSQRHNSYMGDELSSTGASWHDDTSVASASSLTSDDTDTSGLATASDLNEEIGTPVHLVLEGGNLQLYGSHALYGLPTIGPKQSPWLEQISEKSNESYVLFVNGVDDSGWHPNVDFSRYLPLEIPLLRREHDRLLDLLFKFCTSWCMRIVPELFLRDMWRALSDSSSENRKTSHYSPMLHNALLALASAFSDDPQIHDSKNRQLFAHKARSFQDEECRIPNIAVVNALATLASYHACQGDKTLGYLYFGMSGRMSQALGLSVDCSPWVTAGLITHKHMLDRNWVYWTTFSRNVCCFLFVDREFCIAGPSDSKTVHVPFVDFELDQCLWYHAPSRMHPQPNNMSSIFAATCALFIIARRFMEAFKQGEPGTRQSFTHELINKIDVELEEWKDQLEPDVDITLSSRSTALPHRLALHLTYWWLLILLHRPFYRRTHAFDPTESIDHIKICTRATENIMKLLDAWRSLYTLRYIPATLIQVIFSAGTIFVFSAVRAISQPRVAWVSLKDSRSQAELCIEYLVETGKSWPCANHFQRVLSEMLQTHIDAKLSDFHQTLESSVVTKPVDSHSFGPSKDASTLFTYTNYNSTINEMVPSPSLSPNTYPHPQTWLSNWNNITIDKTTQHSNDLAESEASDMASESDQHRPGIIATTSSSNFTHMDTAIDFGDIAISATNTLESHRSRGDGDQLLTENDCASLEELFPQLRYS